MSEKISVVFFGTGPVAAKSLELLSKNFEIEAVITKPKPAHHRASFPVLETANQLSLPIFEVTDKQTLSELFKTAEFTSKVGVLIDFGIIVSQDVIDYFEKGIINSHFSLLPEWRGADPISFSILSGQKKTGVSLMILVEAMDEGPILAIGEQELDGTETTPVLTEKLIHLSDALLRDSLEAYVKNLPHPQTGALIKPSDQIEPARMLGRSTKPSYSRMLTKEDGIIDWSKSAEQIEREIRAFIDWPRSRTKLGSIDVIITKARAIPSQSPNSQPGDIDIVDQISELGIVTSNGTLWIEKLQPAGKKEMAAVDFIRGYRNRLNIEG